VSGALEVEVLPAGVDGWVARIRGHLSSSVESILAAGGDLVSAKAALRHGEFGSVVAGLGMSMDTAQKLMAVARHEVLAKTAPVRLLPASYSTLYELTRLPDDVLVEAVESGRIGPATTRADVRVLVDEVRQVPPGVTGGEAGAPSVDPPPGSVSMEPASTGEATPTLASPVSSSSPYRRLAGLAESPDVHRVVRGYARAQLDVVDPEDEGAVASALADVKAAQFVAGLVGRPGRVGQSARTALAGIEQGDLAAGRAAQLVKRVIDGEGSNREDGLRVAPPAPTSPSEGAEDPEPSAPSSSSAGYDGAQGLQPHHHKTEPRARKVSLDLPATIVASAAGLVEAFDAAGGAQCLEAWCAAHPDRAADVAATFDRLRQLVADAVLFTRPL
jgi:hypothetical protein